MNNREELPVQLQTRSSELINILDGYRNDEYCAILLSLFCGKHPQELGFNEIRRHIIQMTDNVNSSPNALKKHLDHLIGNKVIQKREDKASKMKITPVFFSLTSQFIKVGEDLFTANEGMDVELLKEEWKKQSVVDVSRQVALIILNNGLDSVRDSLILDPRIADFKQVLKSARLKIVLDAYSSIVKDLGQQKEALKFLLEINNKLSDFKFFIKT